MHVLTAIATFIVLGAVAMGALYLLLLWLFRDGWH